MKARQFLAAAKELPPANTPVTVWLEGGWVLTGVAVTWDTGNELLVLGQTDGEPIMIDLNGVLAYQVQPPVRSTRQATVGDGFALDPPASASA